MISSEKKYVIILGVKIDVLTAPELIEKIDQFLEAREKSAVFYVNPDCLNKAHVDEDYRRILNSASLVYADGVGVVIASKLTRQYLPCRITAIDIFHQMCQNWKQEESRLYLLGGSKVNIGLAKSNLESSHPGLSISGYHHGYFDFNSEQNDQVILDINKSKSDVLLVGLGAPIQEKWVFQNLERLNVRLCWCVGGLFDLLSGNLKRGPKILHQNNFEWLCRLLITPQKVWKRYLIGNPKFIYLVLKENFNSTVSNF